MPLLKNSKLTSDTIHSAKNMLPLHPDIDEFMEYGLVQFEYDLKEVTVKLSQPFPEDGQRVPRFNHGEIPAVWTVTRAKASTVSKLIGTGIKVPLPKGCCDVSLLDWYQKKVVFLQDLRKSDPPDKVLDSSGTNPKWRVGYKKKRPPSKGLETYFSKLPVAPQTYDKHGGVYFYDREIHNHH